MDMLSRAPFRAIARSRIVQTAPLGPSRRRFANAAILVETDDLLPDALLARLKRMERDAGRRCGQAWSARPLDLDIILWNGGCWGETGLVIPHPAYRERAFVLDPVCTIAPRWRDPLTGRTIRQECVRHKKPRPEKALKMAEAG